MMSKYQGYNPKTEQVVSVQGEQGENHTQAQMTMDMTKTAWGNPKVRYKDFLLTADVYKTGDGNAIMVHIICPQCKHNLAIKSAEKDIHYDVDQDLLSVEPFKCTWERDDLHVGKSRKFGMSLCNWKVAIDKGVAKDV